MVVLKAYNLLASICSPITSDNHTYIHIYLHMNVLHLHCSNLNSMWTVAHGKKWPLVRYPNRRKGKRLLLLFCGNTRVVMLMYLQRTGWPSNSPCPNVRVIC
jgi:hypothetical protein